MEMCVITPFSIVCSSSFSMYAAHLQSKAKAINYIDASKIEIIEEDGHEGCGFYPDDLLNENCDSIQVRIIAPTIGLAKGMLLKKRGITCIEIPRSMIKAPPSKTCADSWAAVVIKNVFPSEENRQMGRFLDPDAIPANRSWMETDSRKQLSKMHQRMLIGFGVSKSYVKEYTRSAKDPNKLKHCESNMLTICDCIDSV